MPTNDDTDLQPDAIISSRLVVHMTEPEQVLAEVNEALELLVALADECEQVTHKRLRHEGLKSKGMKVLEIIFRGEARTMKEFYMRVAEKLDMDLKSAKQYAGRVWSTFEGALKEWMKQNPQRAEEIIAKIRCAVEDSHRGDPRHRASRRREG